MPSFVINAHKTPNTNGLSPLQHALIHDPTAIRICSAPTGAGKTYAFVKAALSGANILFFVPTRRLAQNLRDEVIKSFVKASTRTDPAEALSDAHSRVVVWTSDQADIDRQIHGKNLQKLRAEQISQMQNGMPDTGTFLIATMESVGHYLIGHSALGGTSKGHNRPSIAEIMSKDHIVFDEFHTLTYQGYGLATAICGIAQNFPLARTDRPRLSFLSATPNDIQPVLEGYGIRREAITTLQETIVSDSSGTAPANMLNTLLLPPRPEETGYRWIHGDVRVDLHEEAASLSELLPFYTDTIKECLKIEKQQILLVYDRLQTVYDERRAIADFFNSIGINSGDILYINSVADSGNVQNHDFGTGGKGTNPENARVLVATSSIEMGVTFKTRFMIIEPGHSLSSLLQRIGRVARGSQSGGVAILYNRKHKDSTSPFKQVHKSFLSLCQGQESNVARQDINHVVTTFLASQTKKWKEKLQPNEDESFNTFEGLPTNTAWTAALFWAAMEWYAPSDGRRDTLTNHRPPKARAIAGALRTITKGAPQQAKTPGVLWANAFARESLNMRGSIQQVTVITPSNTHKVSWHHYARNPYLNTLPITVLEHGRMVIHSTIEIPDIFDYGNDKSKAVLQSTILLPHTVLTLSSPAGQEFETWRHYYQKSSIEPFTDAQRTALESANRLIHWTHVLPTETNLLDNNV